MPHVLFFCQFVSINNFPYSGIIIPFKYFLFVIIPQINSSFHISINRFIILIYLCAIFKPIYSGNKKLWLYIIYWTGAQPTIIYRVLIVLGNYWILIRFNIFLFMVLYCYLFNAYVSTYTLLFYGNHLVCYTYFKHGQSPCPSWMWDGVLMSIINFGLIE